MRSLSRRLRHCLSTCAAPAAPAAPQFIISHFLPGAAFGAAPPQATPQQIPRDVGGRGDAHRGWPCAARRRGRRRARSIAARRCTTPRQAPPPAHHTPIRGRGDARIRQAPPPLVAAGQQGGVVATYPTFT
eukprot:gene7713-biopygen22560